MARAATPVRFYHISCRIQGALSLEPRVALEERRLGDLGRPGLDQQLERLDAFELRPVPGDHRERRALGREHRPIDLLEARRRIAEEAEPLADDELEPLLG